jgi:hypothetical protein
VPNTTTLATATDTSACVAAIAGARAEMAVTPQIRDRRIMLARS